MHTSLSAFMIALTFTMAITAAQAPEKELPKVERREKPGPGGMVIIYLENGREVASYTMGKAAQSKSYWQLFELQARWEEQQAQKTAEK